MGHAGKGASRARIASYINANYKGLAEGAHFNVALRKAIKDGMGRGVIVEGASKQRWKMTDLGRKERKADTKKKYSADDEKEKEKRRKAKSKAKKEKKEKKKAKADTKKSKSKKSKSKSKSKSKKKKPSKRKMRSRS